MIKSGRDGDFYDWLLVVFLACVGGVLLLVMVFSYKYICIIGFIIYYLGSIDVGIRGFVRCSFAFCVVFCVFCSVFGFGFFRVGFLLGLGWSISFQVLGSLFFWLVDCFCMCWVVVLYMFFFRGLVFCCCIVVCGSAWLRVFLMGGGEVQRHFFLPAKDL